MTRLLLVFVNGGILTTQGGLSGSVVTSLSSLASGGFNIITLSNVAEASALFSESQLQQIFDSQQIPLMEKVAFDCAGNDDTDTCVHKVAGLLAPTLAAGTFRLDQSAVIGESAVAQSLANHLGMSFYNTESSAKGAWPGICLLYTSPSPRD